jgi:uncharacterized protein YjdB
MARAHASCRTLVRAGVAGLALALGALSCDEITGLRGSSVPASVDVAPGAVTLDEGQTAQLTAVVHDAKGAAMKDQRIFWTVGDTTIAAVSMSGEVVARRGGSTTVTAIADDGIRGVATLTVRSISATHLIVGPASLTLGPREFAELSVRLVDSDGNPTLGPEPSFTSSNPLVATVNRYGTIDATGEGTATITVRSGDAVARALVTVNVVPVASIALTLTKNAIRVGETTQAIAVARDSAGRVIPDRVVRFGSTNPGAARVAYTGLVTGVGPGGGRITAGAGGKIDSVYLFVALGAVDLVMVNPRKATIIAGQAVQLHSLPLDVGGYRIPGAVVAWGTSDHHVARVDSNGVVTGVSRGIAVITATSEGRSGSTALSVIAPTTGSWARFDSDPGDWIGDGNTYSYTDETASITTRASGVHFRIFIAGGEGWIGHLHLPDSLGRLQPGTYSWPNGSLSSDPTLGGVDWVSESHGCNQVTGSATVDTVRYEYDQLAAIDFSFEQECDGGPPLRGRVHWRPSEPIQPPLPPGPIVPIPNDLWWPPSGATPASENWAYFKSDKGDWVGQGQTYLYASPAAAIDVDAGSAVTSAAHASIHVSEGDANWYGAVQVPNGLDRLQVGYYPNVTRYLFHDPVRGGMEWGGNHNGCNELSGWFVIDAVSYDDAGKLTALDVRFEQHCENQLPALHGAIHWRAATVP